MKVLITPISKIYLKDFPDNFLCIVIQTLLLYVVLTLTLCPLRIFCFLFCKMQIKPTFWDYIEDEIIYVKCLAQCLTDRKHFEGL